MHLSTRGRYAVMALLDLVLIQRERGKMTPVKLSEIAERQEISLSYLEQLFAQMRRSNLVKSVRGPGGGYILGTDPEEMWVNDIIISVNEDMELTRCGGHSDCHKGTKCIAHDLWVALGESIGEFLGKISLAMILDQRIKTKEMERIDMALTQPLKKVTVRVS